MNKRIKATVFAACALLICLVASSAFAATFNSTAYVDYGSASTGDENAPQLFGYMYTQGSIWIQLRDSDSVPPGDEVSLSWANPDKLTGTFFAEAQAPGKNHEGYGRATQVR